MLCLLFSFFFFFLTALSTRKHGEIWACGRVTRTLLILADNRHVLWRCVGGDHLRNGLTVRSNADAVKGCFNLQAAANAPGVARIKLVH